ncbi:MAG: hypothetical protein H0U31_07870 [Chloroflexia bacterium]|nr:hypothetical protein [Chloroflexia bacterium]
MVEFRLAGLLAALSQTSDLGMGQPHESAVRSCMLATGAAHAVDDHLEVPVAVKIVSGRKRLD